MKRRLLLSHCVIVVTAILLLATGSAFSQGDPGFPAENHYKIYEVPSGAPPSVTGPISLRDQFGRTDISFIELEKFGIPAEKHHLDATGEVFPILDPFLHYTWWRFQYTEPARRVDAVDQFGGYSWRLRDSMYLLAPAGKNQAEIPEGNHYKCYQADDAPVVDITVGLVDQVDSVAVVAMYGEYFCNPVEKTFEGIVYPMADSLVHLTCYRVDNTKSYSVTEAVVDQFGSRTIVLEQNMYLCLPAEKGGVVGTEPSSWGRIKALYH